MGAAVMFNLPRPVSLGLAVLEFNPEMPASDRAAAVAMWWRLRRRHDIDLPAQPGEEPITWTLDHDKRADNPTQRGRSTGKARSLATCPECSAVRMEGSPCPVCGWQPRPKPVAVEVADGELGRVDRALRTKGHDWTPGEKTAFHCQLLWIAREKGYKDGWAAHKHKEKFGGWPAGHFAEPEPPDATVRSWVRSRQIAYAKAMAS